MLTKTKLTNLICAVTIGSCVGLANASEKKGKGCSDKQLEQLHDLMSKKDVQIANHDPVMAQKFQNDIDNMEECVIRHKEQTREEAKKIGDEAKKFFNK